MTRVQLKGIVRECVAEWFDRMIGTGEIPGAKRRATVARSQKETEDRLWLTIRKKRAMYEQFLASDQKHARDAIGMLID